jgi:hypothetical protein
MSELVGIIVFGIIAAALVLSVLIHELAKVRLEEKKLFSQGKPGLTDQELDQLAARLAARLARPDEDRKLLLDLAKMSEDEFRVYRNALDEQLKGRDDDRGRDAPKRELG